MPGNVNLNGGINSDWRRALSGGAGGGYTRTDDDAGESADVWTYLTWRPTDAVRMEVNPEYSHHQPDFQYVETADHGDDVAYVYGSLDQKTFDVSFRLDYSVTPDLTIQYYGAPFVSAGQYGSFRRITSPRADSYENRFRRIAEGEIQYDEENESYLVDENGDGVIDYEFGNPDFNVRDFNSNLVVRWQYSPGSSIFVVWSQSRFGFSPDGSFNVRDDMNALFDVHPHNVFLIKVNRWINL
jgi:hypothetical protein